MPEPPSEPARPHGLMARVIEYYRVSILVVGGLVIAGTAAYITLPRSEDPEFDAAMGQIITLWPGVAARQVEDLVTRPLEEAIQGVQGLKLMESDSSASLSVITIKMAPRADPEEVVEEARIRVKDAQRQLPAGAMEPIVLGFNTAKIPVTIVSLYGEAGYDELDRWAKRFEDELAAIDDIADVEIEALPERQIQVRADPQRLSQYRIPVTRLYEALAAENARVPGGKLDIGQQRFAIRNPAEIETPAAIGEVVLGTYAGSVVRIADVATIVDTYQDDTYRARTNRQRAVQLAVLKVERTNTVRVADAIRERAEELAGELPQNIRLAIVSDRGATVDALLSNLGSNAISGGILSMVMVAYFLGIRQATVISVSIPLSVLIAFLCMRATKIDLEQVSIFGLVLAMGMVMDSALVVVENIALHLEQDEPLFTAVTRGTGEVAPSVISSALATVAAFGPMLFLTGDIGSFIWGMPWTLIYSLVASLLVALTVVPLVCYVLWKRFPHKVQHHPEGRGQRFFTEMARRALRHRFLTLFLATAAFAGAVLAIPKLGLQFFPKAEKPLFLIDVRLPRSASLDTTDAVVRQVETLLAAKPEVRDFTVNIGKGSPRVYYNVLRLYETPSYAQVLVNLKADFEGSVDDYVAALEPELAAIGGAEVVPKVLEQGPTSGAPIQVRISGDELETLATLAAEVRRRIADVPGIVDVRDTLGDPTPRLALDLDKTKAALLGVDAYGFSQTVLVALNGATATMLQDGEEEVPVVVRVDPAAMTEVSDLRELHFASRLDGSMVPFSVVATVREEGTFGRISHRDGRRLVTVEADAGGRLASAVTEDVESRIASLKLPPGYGIVVGGEGEERDESFAGLWGAMLLAILLIFGVLAMQFNSFVQPLIILLTVPFGIIGAVFGLWISGNPFGFMAFIGIVSLTGIVVNDSIVICDYVNYLRRVEGKGMNQALLEAVSRRYQPVMLTSVTTVTGMAPLAIWGGSLWAPLANALLWGEAGSTVLILIICPTLYSLLVREDKGKRAYRLLPRLWRRLVGPAEPEPARPAPQPLDRIA